MTANGFIRVRILETGQVIDLIPAAAFPRLNAGTAVLVEDPAPNTFGVFRGVVETAAKFMTRMVR